MACIHKFTDYLNLQKGYSNPELDYLDFKPTTLIVGTFNPQIDGNKAEWFYGRFDNNFWDVLPRLHNENSMRCSKPADWKEFCQRHKIAITDLISSIEDAELSNPLHIAQLKTYSDKAVAEKFKEHKTVKIVDLLFANPTIKNVYLTRGTGEKFWKKLWMPVEQYAQVNSLYERKLLTPSGYAFYQQAKYNKKNPLNPLSLEDYILADWKGKWHVNI